MGVTHHIIEQYGMQLGALVIVTTVAFVAKFDTKLKSPLQQPSKTRHRNPWFYF